MECGEGSGRGRVGVKEIPLLGGVPFPFATRGLNWNGLERLKAYTAASVAWYPGEGGTGLPGGDTGTG